MEEIKDVLAANDSQLSLDTLADAIVEATTKGIGLNVALWDAKCIAKFLCYTTGVVRKEIITQPDFPCRIEIGSGRWKASEVIDWAMSKQRPMRKRS